MTPLRSPYKPSTSDPTMASLSFPHPSVSKFWASISSLLASSFFHSPVGAVSNPTKKEEIASSNLNIRIVREELVANKQMKDQKRKVKWKKAGEFTYLCQQPLCFLPWVSWMAPYFHPAMHYIDLLFLPSHGPSCFPFFLFFWSHLKVQVVKKGSVNKYKDEFVKSKCKNGGDHKLPVSLSPNSSPSGSSSFSSLRCPMISSNLALFAATRMSYLM